MTRTVQIHKRGPKHRQLKWIVENLIRAALVYGVNQALDYLYGFRSLVAYILQKYIRSPQPYAICERYPLM